MARRAHGVCERAAADADADGAAGVALRGRREPRDDRHGSVSSACPTASSFSGRRSSTATSLLALGRRRGWLLLTQIALAASIALLGTAGSGDQYLGRPDRDAASSPSSPRHRTSSSTRIDANRSPTMSKASAASFYTYGYRLGMLLASAGGLILADIIGFNAVYFAHGRGHGGLRHRHARRAGARRRQAPCRARSFESFIGPFVEFFTRRQRVESAARARLHRDLQARRQPRQPHVDPFLFAARVHEHRDRRDRQDLRDAARCCSACSLAAPSRLNSGLYRAMFVIGVLQAASTACFVLLALRRPRPRVAHDRHRIREHDGRHGHVRADRVHGGAHEPPIHGHSVRAADDARHDAALVAVGAERIHGRGDSAGRNSSSSARCSRFRACCCCRSCAIGSVARTRASDPREPTRLGASKLPVVVDRQRRVVREPPAACRSRRCARPRRARGSRLDSRCASPCCWPMRWPRFDHHVY